MSRTAPTTALELLHDIVSDRQRTANAVTLLRGSGVAAGHLLTRVVLTLGPLLALVTAAGPR